MKDAEKALTYEEAKQLCRMAFDAGADYGIESARFHCNAVAYDWEHWLNKNEHLFMPKPTVEDVLREFADEVWNRCCEGATASDSGIDELVAECAAKLRLAGENA